MHRIGRFVVCVGLFCLADATHVSADPILISSGFLLVTGPGGGLDFDCRHAGVLARR